MKVKRVIKFNIKKSHPDYNYIKQQLIESKEVYNYCNYILRQLYFKNSKSGNKYSLNFINEYAELKDLFVKYIEENKQFTSLFYKIICDFSKIKKYSINTKIVQNIINKLQDDWKSYWVLLKKKKSKEYDKNINIPKYKKVYNLVEYNNQVISKKKLKCGFIGTFNMKQGFKIHSKYKNYNFKCFRCFYKNNKIICELIYEKEIEEIEETKENNRVACIDLGINNLFTISFNFNKRPIVISGKKIKSINRYFNKEISKLQSLLNKNIYISNKINLLYFKRYEQIRNEIGLYLNKFIKVLKSYNVTKVIVGYNKGWKQEINLGKKNNQSFVNISFRTILNILSYKLEDNNISYCEQEESYTSKASFIDNDFIPVYNFKENKDYIFSGKRIKRGLYKTLNNILIHSDLNGSLNIMRKAKIRILEELSYLKNKYIFPLNLFNFV